MAVTHIICEESRCVFLSSMCLFLVHKATGDKRLDHILTFSPADLHECCLAWLGHSHVTLPGYPALVLKLPHRQVKPFSL